MVHFRYKPTFDDYSALNRHVFWRALRMPALFLGLPFIAYCLQPLALGAFAGHQGNGNDFHFNPMVFVLPLLVLVLVYAIRSRIRKTWEKLPQLQAEKEYHLDEEGIQVSGSTFSGFMEWRSFETAESSKGYIFLKIHGGQYHVFPESSVPDLPILKDLLVRKIKKTKNIK